MSRFLRARLQNFTSYTPGEQPRNEQLIKLNTNESPFPPAPAVVEAARREAALCHLYSDPSCTALRQRAAEVWDVEPEMVLPVNGSDEVLNFAFMAFGGEGVAYPAVSYGFYPVLAGLHNVPALEVPLREDFSIDFRDYLGLYRTVVLANPNAPTGLALPLEEVEAVVAGNPGNVVVIDEAYVDFGAESALPLTKKYENLLVTRTFSKSHSLAGARLGFAIGNPALIRDLETVKFATNPYSVNRMTLAMGEAAFRENGYYLQNCRVIAENRDYTAGRLRELGFRLTDSKANFLFARSDRIGGLALYRALRERGILVRHFDAPAVSDFNRVTVGTRAQMDAFLDTVTSILSQQEANHD